MKTRVKWLHVTVKSKKTCNCSCLLQNWKKIDKVSFIELTVYVPWFSSMPNPQTLNTWAECAILVIKLLKIHIMCRCLQLGKQLWTANSPVDCTSIVPHCWWALNRSASGKQFTFYFAIFTCSGESMVTTHISNVSGCPKHLCTCITLSWSQRIQQGEGGRPSVTVAWF